MDCITDTDVEWVHGKYKCLFNKRIVYDCKEVKSYDLFAD